jgi:hypothetical protein
MGGVISCKIKLAMEWINVKDKLPPNNVAVLVTGKGISIDIGWKLDSRNYEWCKYHGGELFQVWQKVEWWQFLPETPRA